MSGWLGGQSVSLNVVLVPLRGNWEQISSGSLYTPTPLQSCPRGPHPLPCMPCPHPGLNPVPLFWAFLADYKNELAHLATCSLENPKLEMLEQILREQFGSSDSPRGIIFTQTRQSAHSLLLWLRQQPGLQTMDMRADLLIGAGNSSQNSHMTQVWALRKRAGTGGVPRGERVGIDSSQSYGGLISPGRGQRTGGERWTLRSPGLEVFLI